MPNYISIVKHIDKIASNLESRGLLKEAADLDIISNTLEMVEAADNDMQKAISLAKANGVNLNPENVAEFINKYYDPELAGGPVEAAGMGSNAKALAMAAALLVSSIMSTAQAKGPITIDFPTGPKTYSARDLKQLERRDPKTFAVIMEQAVKQEGQQAKGLQQQKRRQEQMQKSPQMTGKEKVVKDTEILTDDFGNQAKLTVYQDDTKDLEGDYLIGGMSFRKMLERKGEIPEGGGEYAAKR